MAKYRIFSQYSSKRTIKNNMTYIETRFPPDYFGGIQNPHLNENAPINKTDGTTLLTVILAIVVVAIVTHQLNQSLIQQKNNTNQYE
jgi:hypothetical protein